MSGWKCVGIDLLRGLGVRSICGHPCASLVDRRWIAGSKVVKKQILLGMVGAALGICTAATVFAQSGFYGGVSMRDRGAESGGLLRQLVRRGLVAVVHRGEAAQREVAYGTTARFLELFSLGSLDDLPQTQDLQKL